MGLRGIDKTSLTPRTSGFDLHECAIPRTRYHANGAMKPLVVVLPFVLLNG